MFEFIEHTINKIDSLIQEQLPESKYQFELYDLITNTKHFRGYDEPFHWGSVYKLFVIAEIIKMSEEGLLNLEDELILRKDLYKNGNGILKFFTHLERLTYLDACKMVMATSDNLCSDELLNVVGFERFNKLLRIAHCHSSKLIVNLDSMVKFLFKGISSSNEAYFFQSVSYFKHFNIKLSELLMDNYTTVQDINNGYHYILNEYLSEEKQTTFMECVLMPNQHTRINYYTVYSAFTLKGKTGTLGTGIINNENAAIIHKKTQKVFGYFAINTQENEKRYFQCNDTIGLIGLEIANLYEQLYERTK